MATTKQLSELFRALAGHDVPRAAEAARRIAQAEADRGNHGAARDLLGSLNGYATQQRERQTHPVAHSIAPSQCLERLALTKPLDELELSPSARKEIADLAAEWKHRASLANSGIPRRWRLLFHGPPGCGKSATATALGHLIGLPVWLVRFDALIGSYLGQTALRLREVFRFAAETPCVLLFDEVDALAKRRGSPLELGELDRVVIAFMQELEHAASEGFIIATCNLPRTLDAALWRRFDLALEFPKPAASALAAFGKKRLAWHGMKLAKPLATRIAKSGSYACAEQLLLDEVRRRALAKLK
jgi:SpoVK/Ycf46/Vps4 family AAA+-type ATPase